MGYQGYDNNKSEEELEYQRMLERLPEDKRSIFEEPKKKRKEKKKKIIIFITITILFIIIVMNRFFIEEIKDYNIAEMCCYFLGMIFYPDQYFK